MKGKLVMKADCYICEHFVEVACYPDCKLGRAASPHQQECDLYKYSEKRQKIVERNIKKYYSNKQLRDFGYFD